MKNFDAFRQDWLNMIYPVKLETAIVGRIPQATRDFLTEVGLPDNRILFRQWEVYLRASAPTNSLASLVSERTILKAIPTFEPANFKFISFAGAEFLVIGKRGETAIAINLENEHVCLLVEDIQLGKDTHYSKLAMFINSSLPLYLRFLVIEIKHKYRLLHHITRQNLIDTSGKPQQEIQNINHILWQNIQAIYEQMETELAQIDPPAFELDHAWWKLQLKYAKVGL